MSRTTPKLIADSLRTAPTPMMALVLVCVVETGMPSTVITSRHSALDRSAEKPWYFSSRTMSCPTDLMMRSPPTLVPTPMIVLHRIISHTGMITPATPVCPLQNAMPRNRTPMNFWPSCAPCMKLMAAAPTICAYVKNTLARLRSSPAQISVTSLHTIQPMPNPSRRLAARPYSTLTHSPMLMPPMPSWMAMAAPERPAIRLWLSDVGMPSSDAPTL